MKNNRIIQQLDTKILVSDGGMGTEIEKLNIIKNPELWSSDALINHPNAIYKIHQAYLKSGANILTTATYQANPIFLKAQHAILSNGHTLIGRAVDIVKKVKTDFVNANPFEQQPLIAGSVGPYGAYLNDGSEYTGNYDLTIDTLKKFHYPHLKLLAENDVDFFAFETIPNFTEATALNDLLRESFPNSMAWLSLSINDNLDLCDDTPLAKVLNYIADNPQIFAIGVNCTNIENINPIIQILKTHTSKAIVVYPNNGDIYNKEEGKWIPRADSPSFTEVVPTWIKSGATIIGGCCRTTPKDIQDISNIVIPHNKKNNLLEEIPNE